MRFWLHPTSLQRKFPNGWRVLNQTCFNSPSDLTQSRKSMDSLTQTSLLQPIRFDANPKVGGEFVQDTIRSFHIFNQHLSSCLRARLKRIHPAFTKMISLDYLSRHLFTSVQTQPPRSGLALTGGRCAIQSLVPTGRDAWA